MFPMQKLCPPSRVASKTQGVPASSSQDLSSDFGAQLYERRTFLRMTQSQLAAKAAVSTAYVSEIENGRRLPPTRRTAVRMAKALQLTGAPFDRFVGAAVLGRGAERPDEELPNEVRLLITDLRVYAFQLPAHFIAALRGKVKEVVM